MEPPNKFVPCLLLGQRRRVHPHSQWLAKGCQMSRRHFYLVVTEALVRSLAIVVIDEGIQRTEPYPLQLLDPEEQLKFPI